MKHLFIALLILLNSACSTPSNKQAALHDFGVYTPPTGKQTGIKADITVESPEWLGNQCIQYRLLYSEPTRLRCYNLDQWIAPPTELFKQQLLTSAIPIKQRLHIQILNFEQQFDAPKQARVVLTLVVNAYQPQTDRLIASQTFQLQQTTASPDAAGAVTAFAHLTQQANIKIQLWLQSLG
jgi:cholesterol transport system auxiliary component